LGSSASGNAKGACTLLVCRQQRVRW